MRRAAVVVMGLLFVPAGFRSEGRADDDVVPWQEQPVVSDGLRFLNVESQSEAGRSFQRFRFESAGDFQSCRIEAPLPPLLPLEEFRASTRVNATHAGIRLAVRLVLPRQLDPRTGQPLTTWISGSRSTEAAEWQELSVSLSDAAIRRQLVLVRSQLAPKKIDADGLYIDRLGLMAEFSTGVCVIDAEPVRYGPVVRRMTSAETPADETMERPADDVRAAERTRVRVERNQVFFGDRRAFLRLMPWHGEPAEQLAAWRVNTLWVPDYRSDDRLQDLAETGFMLAATPPHPQFDPGDFSEPIAGLMPLDQASDVVDIWLLGTRVPPSQLPHLQAWAREVRSADRIRRRPLMVDVIGAEGLASRCSDMVGIGLPSIHRNLTLGQFRNQILLRSRQASQLTLPWCWIQTESPGSMTAWRAKLGLPPLPVEPEQILMQVMAALSAGSRAIGYWKTASWSGDGAGDSEAGLAVGLANLHIDLLEDWLVQGQVQSWIAVDIDSGRRGRSGRPQSVLQQTIGSSLVSLNPLETRLPRRPDACVISGPHGSLILAVMWDASSQFVPGSLYAPEARMTVGARETASASQITVTGIRGQRRVETAGGLAVTLKDLDQFAVLLVSSDPAAFRRMGQRIQKVAPQAADLKTRMARLKYERVLRITEQIDRLRPTPPPSAESWLRQADRFLQSAQASHDRGRFADASRQADRCLRYLRRVQNLYWQDAIRELPTPTASPFTVAFDSLPEHWQMRNTIDQASPSDSLLPAGLFERRQALEDAGWQFLNSEDSPWTTWADVRFDARNRVHVLRLAASRPASARVLQPAEPSVAVRGPLLSVTAGDLIEITGRVRIGSRIRPDSEHPLLIFDSELGPEFAVRPALESSWRTFRMYRQAAQTGPFRISLALQGQADVHLDLDSLAVRKCGQAVWETGRSGRPVRSVSGSRMQDGGHAFPSSDRESSSR